VCLFPVTNYVYPHRSQFRLLQITEHIKNSLLLPSMVYFHVRNFCFYHAFICKGILSGQYIPCNIFRLYAHFTIYIKRHFKLSSFVHQSCPTLVIHVTCRQLDLRRVQTFDTSCVENFASSYVAKIEFEKFYMTSKCCLTL
jgi:hypothetical protein